MEWIDIAYVLVLSLVSLAFLFFLTKMMGNRQMSQLTMFDYISGITLGSLAGEMASHPDAEAWLGLVSMAVYGGMTLLINVLNDKSRKARRFILGQPTVLYDRGTLYYNSLRQARLDLTEFTTACRNAGYFDLSQLQMVVMEINGKLSFLPNEPDRPLTPRDMQLAPAQCRPPTAIIMDGVFLPERLKATGNTESWLTKQMELQGFKDVKDIFLATVDADNALSIYEKNEDVPAKPFYS
ncbi:MAG: DUF421 domain-containing protein [Clostridiales bacterium]|nr:DUF421 domain-containing protein [Clostridiales bacterium]MDO4350898.1 DUF421 domain-containing protein [Eubacteriales bacterium]MDY4009827.1 DUF421 domain-containing protein [Candidatus Limiplasma sp.]